MTILKMSLLLAGAAGIALGLTSCNRTGSGEVGAADEPAASNDPIESAMSAAPEAVSGNARIVTVKADGSMQTLREGSNGWTCMPDSPDTPGPDPMCVDGNALKFIEAWIGHKTPPADAVGLAYMLSGGTDASNTDPYAKGPAEGNNWIETGPHLMVLGSREILEGHPSSPDPDTKRPYVMWAGTPYAHLMIPVR